MSDFKRECDALSSLETALRARYPFFKRQVPGCCVYDNWGIESGPGWTSLLIAFADKSVELGATVRFLQIKEKYNKLRIYAEITPSDGVDDMLFDFIDYLEDRSAELCEVCGGVDHGHRHQHTSTEFIQYCEQAIRGLEEH